LKQSVRAIWPSRATPAYNSLREYSPRLHPDQTRPGHITAVEVQPFLVLDELWQNKDSRCHRFDIKPDRAGHNRQHFGAESVREGHL